MIRSANCFARVSSVTLTVAGMTALKRRRVSRFRQEETMSENLTTLEPDMPAGPKNSHTSSVQSTDCSPCDRVSNHAIDGKSLRNDSARIADAKKSPTRALRGLLFALITGLLISQSVGCSSMNRFDSALGFDGPMAVHRNKIWAKRAFNLRYGNCDKEYADHFRDGFVEGYCDVCSGNKGYVPAMPPKHYWDTRYQCPEGAQCVNSWFEGFPAGAVAARKDGSGAYHDMYISNMMHSALVQRNAPAALPGDIPVTQPRESAAAPPSMEPLVPGSEFRMDMPENFRPPIVDPTAQMPLPMTATPVNFDYSEFEQ